MKKTVFPVIAATIIFSAITARAETEDPQVYVIQKGDTLWGVSERFVKDPQYWPDIWAKNPEVTKNPHFIYPGQKIRFSDGKLIVDPPVEKQPQIEAPIPPPVEKAPEPAPITFTVSGGEGFIDEGQNKRVGNIISSYTNRELSGEDDIVYTDIGRKSGAKVGDRYSIYQKSTVISHPVTNMIIGHKIIPLGSLLLSELEDKVSKAIITKSYMEIAPGAFLMPYTDKKKIIQLKSSDRDVSGFILETKTGNKAIATGDIAYLDMGDDKGVKVGNMVYVIRDVQADQKFVDASLGKLPPEVIGAMVVVETTKSTCTALVVKSIDTIYKTDRIELIKNR